MLRRCTLGSQPRTLMALLWLVLHLSCTHAFRPLNDWESPGVGFSLTTTYATAAVWFANNTSIQIARIEGGPEYEHFMRQLEPPSSLHDQKCDFFPTPFRDVLEFLSICPRQPDFDSTTSLFRSLRHAVEAYLETPFCFVSIAVESPRSGHWGPDPALSYHNAILQKSVVAVGLRQVLPSLHAGETAFVANSKTIEKDRNLFPAEQAVLTVGFSDSGFNLALLYDNYHDMREAHPVRIRWEPNLARGNGEPPLKYWRDIRKTLLTFVKPPFDKPRFGGSLPGVISQVVLYGNKVMDTKFLEVLSAAVGRDVLERAHKFDPVFASAVGVARQSFESINDYQFHDKAAFGCRWRSELYHTNPFHESL